MSYQLWTLPLTGYRRTGTRVSEIRRLFETGVTVRSIYEPLKACSAEADATEMMQLLIERSFDVAGVKEGDKPITHFVTASELKRRTVRDHAQRISIEDVLSDATPLARMFSLLAARPYSFVLVDDMIAGIVTRGRP